METTIELKHNGKRAYAFGGKKYICDDIIKQKKDKAYNVRVTASTSRPAGAAESVSVEKTTANGWVRKGTSQYPLVIFSGGQEVLNSFFPSAKNGDTKTIWLQTTIIKHREKD